MHFTFFFYKCIESDSKPVSATSLTIWSAATEMYLFICSSCMCQDWFEVIHLRDSIYLLFGLPCRRCVLSYKMTICNASSLVYLLWKGRASCGVNMYYSALPTFIHTETASQLCFILPVEVSVCRIFPCERAKERERQACGN